MKITFKAFIPFITTIFLTLSVAVSAVALSEDELEILPDNPVEYKIGDVTLDGVVNIKDAVYVQKFCLSMLSFNDTQTKLGDVNGDGKIGLGDAIYLQKTVLGFTMDSDKNDIVELPIIPARGGVNCFE